MLTAIELQLNRIAQGFVLEAEGCSWFESLQPEARVQALQVLANICQQSHPLPEEASQAVERSGLKATFTPCVLLKLAVRPEHTFHRIIALPQSEQVRSFRLLMSLFAIADSRRRESHCKQGCTHE